MNSLSIGLTADELYEVTHYRYPRKQIEALTSMDIPFKIRPDGSVFVARTAIENDPTALPIQKSREWEINM